MKLMALNLPRDFNQRDLEKLFKAHGTKVKKNKIRVKPAA